MAEIIPTAQIAGVETDQLENDDAYQGTYGFYVRLTRDPGREWFLELQAVYDAAEYAGKPPIEFRGDRLVVFYLPRYAGDLPKYLQFLLRSIAEANQEVEKRNRVVPDEEKEKADFLQSLRNAAEETIGAASK
ncbi:MAG: hypothetical protein H7Z41_19155 [Cytophagales bacterium]|nr:hypothetical protein [Armatimonadota bacterium]